MYKNDRKNDQVHICTRNNDREISASTQYHVAVSNSQVLILVGDQLQLQCNVLLKLYIAAMHAVIASDA
jgi:hypothetical protein